MRAELDTGSYPTGETVPDEVMGHLPLVPHDWHGKWNYRLRCEPPAPPWPDPAFGRFPPMDRAQSWLGHPTLTGLEPAAFGALHDLYLEHVNAHPTAVLPGKRRAFGTGSRKLSTTDRLTATLITLRWRTPRAALAGIPGVCTATVSHTVREVTADLQAPGHTVPQGPIPVRTAKDLAALVHQPAS